MVHLTFLLLVLILVLYIMPEESLVGKPMREVLLLLPIMIMLTIELREFFLQYMGRIQLQKGCLRGCQRNKYQMEGICIFNLTFILQLIGLNKTKIFKIDLQKI